jgi:hypothetical protein
MFSGAIAAALITMKGPFVRAEWAWSARAVSSLPAPAGPMIRMRLLAGATFSTTWRNWFIDGDLPTSVDGASCLSALTSRLRREVSSARCATSTSRSALNGFSMKS